MKIETKAEYYEKWNAGALGNKLRSWPSLAPYGSPTIVAPCNAR